MQYPMIPFSFANDIILLTYVSSLISSIYIDIIGKLSST